MNLTELLADAGLTGRGGAAFPTAIKLSAAIDNQARLIVNACDGEIGAYKDGWVVKNRLNELRAGAEMISTATGQPVLWAAHKGSETAKHLITAGLPVLETPGRYVSSEESALTSLADGGLARPLTKRAPLSMGFKDSRGTQVKPTLVLNAETVWRLAQIAQLGSQWYRSFGTATEPGPRLVSVTRADGQAFVVETQAGAKIKDILTLAGETTAPQHLLIGGLGGTFLAMDSNLTWSDADLAPLGARVGPGIIQSIDDQQCPLNFVEGMLRYAAGESAGQCGPCMFGVPETLTVWAQFTQHPDRQRYDVVLAHSELLKDRGACRFPDGVAGFVASAARIFAPHAAQHSVAGCSTTTTVR